MAFNKNAHIEYLWKKLDFWVEPEIQQYAIILQQHRILCQRDKYIF